MWLGKKIAENRKEREKSMAGTISGEKDGGLLLQAAAEYREVSLCGTIRVKACPCRRKRRGCGLRRQNLLPWGGNESRGPAAWGIGPVFRRRRENHPDPRWENPIRGSGIHQWRTTIRRRLWIRQSKTAILKPIRTGCQWRLAACRSFAAGHVPADGEKGKLFL